MWMSLVVDSILPKISTEQHILPSCKTTPKQFILDLSKSFNRPRKKREPFFTDLVVYHSFVVLPIYTQSRESPVSKKCMQLLH